MRLWKQFAELGFTGIMVSEEDGGVGMGHVEAGIVLEEIGRNLTPSPFLTSSVLAATALKHGSATCAGAICRVLSRARVCLRLRLTKGPSTVLSGYDPGGEIGQWLQADRAKRTLSFMARARICWWSPRAPSGSDDDADGITLFAVPVDAANMHHDPCVSSIAPWQRTSSLMA